MSSARSFDPVATAQAFLQRWKHSGGSERSNYTSFLNELSDLLGIRRSDPATPDNAHVFERAVEMAQRGITGYIDLYKRGCLVCETKQVVEKEENAALSEKLRERRRAQGKGHGIRGTAAYDEVTRKARSQAEAYARNLPADVGRPPFLLVIDVGHSIELWSEFTCSGGEYVQFPDAQARIRELGERLDAFRKERQRLHPELTLTGLYNVLEKLRARDALTAKERKIHEDGCVSILQEIHDHLDTAVLEAYGWDDIVKARADLKRGYGTDLRSGNQWVIDDEQDRHHVHSRNLDEQIEELILFRLVELNRERAVEEAEGKIRWLRPEYQDPEARGQRSETGEPETGEAETVKQTDLDLPTADRPPPSGAISTSTKNEERRTPSFRGLRAGRNNTAPSATSSSPSPPPPTPPPSPITPKKPPPTASKKSSPPSLPRPSA